MGLLARSRRLWIVVFVGLLWLPMLGQALLPPASQSEAEARVLEPLPALPASQNGLTRFPRLLDQFLADHFGFRDQLIQANALVRHQLKSPTNVSVLYGKDGFFFYLEHATLEQSLGLVVREKPIERLADALARLHDELHRRNIKFLFTSPPNNSTINANHLPDWLKPSRGPTEYDLMLRLLAARGVPTLDLRPALRAESSALATYFQTDTHWNFLGALIARNEIARAIGHPDWMMDVGRVFRGMRRTYGERDLPRLLGLRGFPEEQDAVVDVSSYTNADGPNVLVIGDSFTNMFFPAIWRNGGRATFVHHPGCRFDADEVMKHGPEIVIVSIVERSLPLLCDGGAGG